MRAILNYEKFVTNNSLIALWHSPVGHEILFLEGQFEIHRIFKIIRVC